jgi:GTP-binding protein
MFIIDMKLPGQKIIVAKGGRGGRGNASFKTHNNTAPYIAENGEPGEEVTLELELKLIADVGLIGCPNAGKSTLLSKVTAARPKIADYPFTTLSPNLGVVNHKNKSFVMADIPGLIEGAHAGKGLGYEFLRHIERTKILVHIIDISGFGEHTAFANFVSINNELKKYSKTLSLKPMLVVLNKSDITGADKLAFEFKKKIKQTKKYTKLGVIYTISAVTGSALGQVLDKLIEMIDNENKRVTGHDQSVVEIMHQQVAHYKFEPEFTVTTERDSTNDRIFIVSGKKVDKLIAMTNFSQDQAVTRLQNILKKMGVIRALRKHGVKEGDTVKIKEFEMQYTDDEISSNQ